MISYLQGSLKQKLSDRVVVLAGGVGYDVFLPQFVMRSMDEVEEGADVEFEIYYHVTERQIRPTLIGFNNAFEKQFFEKFISVEDIGPQKAARALSMSVSTIAQAIESEDYGLLRRLPGIGDRTAKKMVATLRGKVAEEALLQDAGFSGPAGAQTRVEPNNLREDGIQILMDLGHRRPEATTKVDAAFKRDSTLASIDDLIVEVYQGEREQFGG